FTKNKNDNKELSTNTDKELNTNSDKESCHIKFLANFFHKIESDIKQNTQLIWLSKDFKSDIIMQKIS
ncbi:11437_t:CDS:1, partial [Dentiscutata heterogama]